MQYERRDFDLTPELRMDADATRIVGYAAVFNRYSHDLGGFVERILPGAFKRVLNRGDDVLALYNHAMDNLLATRAAGTLRLSEDETGLRYEFDLDPSDPDHQRVIAKVKRGDLRGSSFGFRVETDEWATTDEDYPLRSIKSVAALRDVGPVSQPAYPDTATIAPLALRGLAETTGLELDDLVAAGTHLRYFLLRSQEDDTAQDTADGSSGETAPELPVERSKHILPPRIARVWWADYSKGV